MPEYCPFCGRKLKLWERNLDMLIANNGCLKCNANSPEFWKKFKVKGGKFNYARRT